MNFGHQDEINVDLEEAGISTTSMQGKNREHWGIIFSRQLPIGETLRRLLKKIGEVMDAPSAVLSSSSLQWSCIRPSSFGLG